MWVHDTIIIAIIILYYYPNNFVVPTPSSITLVSSDYSLRPNSLPILGSDVWSVLWSLIQLLCLLKSFYR
jgi:hypothetical protein